MAASEAQKVYKPVPKALQKGQSQAAKKKPKKLPPVPNTYCDQEPDDKEQVLRRQE